VAGEAWQLRRQPGQGLHDTAGIYFDANQVFIETLFDQAGFAVGIGVDRSFLSNFVTVTLVAGFAGVVMIRQHQGHAGKVQDIGLVTPIALGLPELPQQGTGHFAACWRQCWLLRGKPFGKSSRRRCPFDSNQPVRRTNQRRYSRQIVHRFGMKLVVGPGVGIR
jgi:hypothetical protein